jgi:hypothetical protein
MELSGLSAPRYHDLFHFADFAHRLIDRRRLSLQLSNFRPVQDLQHQSRREECQPSKDAAETPRTRLRGLLDA